MKRVLAVSLVLLLLCSCVDFDEQTVYFFYDKQKDELHLLVLYQGIHSNENVAESKKDLTKFVTTDWEIAIHSWIGHITKEEIKETINDENTPVAAKKLITFFLENITVTNGKFFHDKDKRLCGYQIVTIKNTSKHIELLNKLISESVPEQINKNEEPFGELNNELNKKSIDLITTAARKNHQWIKLVGQSIQFSFPISDEDFVKTKTALLEVLKYYEEEGYKNIGDYFSRNEIAFTRDGKFVTLILGNKGVNRPIQVLVRPEEEKYQDNLVEFAKEKFGISSELTEESVVDQFISSLVDPELVKKIEGLIRKLGDDDWKVREKATKELIEMDSLVVPWVRNALKSDDAEIRVRATLILKTISTWPEEKPEEKKDLDK